MKLVSIVVFVIFGLITTVTGTDYCLSSLCSGRPHIGCQNNGNFAATCPIGKTSMVTITSSLRDKILDSHNSKRNTLAAGNLPGFKSAVRMPTMQWSDELALLASYNVKTCQFAHDKCRNTDQFKYSGQNLGKFWWSGGSYTDEQIILARIESWWAEKKDTLMSDLEKYPSSTTKTIGHFTVMTSDRNIAVGCAAVRFPEDTWNTMTLACNYAATNMIGRALYTSGTTASKCETGVNPTYPALCSTSENVDPNAI